MPRRPRASAPRHPDRASRESAARELGARGEQLAVEHYERLGFALVARNVRSRAGEIDLIAFDGRTLVFAEVKTTRAGDRAPATPAAALARLDGRQRARIRRLASAWLCGPARAGISARELRLDAVGVVVDRDGRLIALEQLESAW
ncbi:MAG TPA: YraN family protein [Solirubrobacteraceae bacterium]|nr:YraN family protein [Solirubrobacteraceae bacterium]